MKLDIVPPQMFGLPTDCHLKGLYVSVDDKRVQVVYTLKVYDPQRKTVIQQYDGQYIFSDNIAQSMHALRLPTDVHLHGIGTKVPGNGKYTRWFEQLAPVLLPAIAAEVADLLPPSSQTE